MSVLAQAKVDLTSLRAEVAALQGQIAALQAQITAAGNMGAGGSTGTGVPAIDNPLLNGISYPEADPTIYKGLSTRRLIGIASTVNSAVSVVENWNTRSVHANAYLTNDQLQTAEQQKAQEQSVRGLVSQGISTSLFLISAPALIAAGPAGWALLAIGGIMQAVGWGQAAQQTYNAYSPKQEDSWNYNAALWR